MTITYLGAANSKKLEAAIALLTEINKKRPLNVKIGKTDTFGSKEYPVLVKRVSIENPELEKILVQMHQKLGVCEPFQKEKLEIPNWHISIKNPELEKEFLKLENTIVTGGKLFIKPLGKFDPIIELE